MQVLVKILLVAVFPFLVLGWALNRVMGIDRLRLRQLAKGESGWVKRAGQPDVNSYFSERSVGEGGTGRSAARIPVAVLVALARLFRPRKAEAGAPYKPSANREESIPDEVYTLW